MKTRNDWEIKYFGHGCILTSTTDKKSKIIDIFNDLKGKTNHEIIELCGFDMEVAVIAIYNNKGQEIDKIIL